MRKHDRLADLFFAVVEEPFNAELVSRGPLARNIDADAIGLARFESLGDGTEYLVLLSIGLETDVVLVARWHRY
jgi:hypothetical protein